MKTTTVSEAPIDSIEISVTSKGDYTYTAKVYYEGNPQEAQERLEKIDAWFKEKFKKIQ